MASIHSFSSSCRGSEITTVGAGGFLLESNPASVASASAEGTMEAYGLVASPCSNADSRLSRSLMNLWRMNLDCPSHPSVIPFSNEDFLRSIVEAASQFPFAALLAGKCPCAFDLLSTTSFAAYSRTGQQAPANAVDRDTYAEGVLFPMPLGFCG